MTRHAVVTRGSHSTKGLLLQIHWELNHEDLWEVEDKTNIFLAQALDGDTWSASWFSRFTPREEEPGTDFIGSWVVFSQSGHDDEYNHFSLLDIELQFSIKK